MRHAEIYNQSQLMELIGQVGFLPLLDSGIRGYSAEEVVSEDCRYVVFTDGGWDWPLWKWKGPIVTEGDVVYGKFFAGKAGFISREWWPDFCNYRRGTHLLGKLRTNIGEGSGNLFEGSIEEAILLTLQEHGSLITRELRAACGFTGSKMRSRFDAYITRLQMACHIVTEDFVYPLDKHGREYGWGWSLLTTPEQLYGRDACRCSRSSEESFQRILAHFRQFLPEASEKEIVRIIK